MKNIKIFGEMVLVAQVLEKNTALDAKGVFKGVVEIIQFGEKVEDRFSLIEGDKVLIREHCLYTCPYTKENYIRLEQIIRTV